MGLIACPSCGNQGKVPDQLLGKKIKCQICGTSFQTAAPRVEPATPQAGDPGVQAIEVVGLLPSNWAMPGCAWSACGQRRTPTPARSATPLLPYRKSPG